MNGNQSSSATTGDGEGTSSGMLRRPSKRQQEKAPEGRTPHVVEDEDMTPTADMNEQAGPAPAESRFSENI